MRYHLTGESPPEEIPISAYINDAINISIQRCHEDAVIYDDWKTTFNEARRVYFPDYTCPYQHIDQLISKVYDDFWNSEEKFEQITKECLKEFMVVDDANKKFIERHSRESDRLNDAVDNIFKNHLYAIVLSRDRQGTVVVKK